MRKLFLPAAFLTRRLSYKRKFILLGLIYVMSIVVVASSLYERLDMVIRGSRLELQGLALIQPISRVTQLSQLHRGLSLAVAAGNLDLRERHLAAASDLERAFLDLDRKLAGSLVPGMAWKGIMTRWKDLRNRGPGMTADENFSAHTELIDQLLKLQVSAGDHYGLTLDSEIGAYYLIDTLISKLPEALEHLGQLRAKGTESLTRREFSDVERARLLALTYLARDQLKLLMTNLDKTAEFVPEIRAALRQMAADISSQTTSIADYLHSEILARRQTALPANFFSKATASIDNGYAQMNQTLVPTIENLIKDRIRRAERELTVSVGLALLLLLLVCYVVVGIFYTTMESINSLRRSAQKFAGGDMSERIHLTTQDEISQVGSSFNEMADGFNSLLIERTETQERVSAIINSALDAMVQIDSGGIVTGWSKQAEQCFGWTYEEAIRQPLHEMIIPFRYREAHVRGIKNYAASGHGPVLNNSRIEIEGLHRAGHEFPIELSISPIKTARGTEFSAFIRDVTVRKKAEQELRKAREVAEASNIAKSAFLANMSHEIRTPMNAIVGLTHLLRRAAPTLKQAEQLKKIEGAASHLLSIINDILDISKIEAGRMELEQTDFHLGILLDNVYSLVADQARAKGLAVVVDPDTVPLWLRGDPTRVRQALLNYAANAIKFTESGLVTLRARMLEEADDEIFVRFEVEDTGIGIPAEKLGSLFKAFEQADVSTTRKYGGTGLGLAITQRLSVLMGGDAGVQSIPGQGSTFWFTARLRRGHGIMPTPGAADKEDAEAELQLYAGMRILLVDDVAMNREVAQLLLEGTGLVIDSAENGRQAVDMARDVDYALILMDVQMPVMDGLDATRFIHALPGRQATRILAMTANAFDEDRRACIDAGMIDFIPKPVDADILFRTLLKWLRKPVVAAAGAQPIDSPEVAAVTAPDGVPVTQDLPGLEIGRGLNIWRKEEIFRKFLRKFADDYADSVRTMALSLSAGDKGKAAAMAHKLKGVAGNLALTGVARHAGDVDQRLKSGEDVAGALDQLQRTMDTALASIDHYAPVKAASSLSMPDLDPAQAARMAPLFLSLLEALDADTPDRAEPLLDELATVVPAEHLQLVRATLSEFDFRAAEVVVRQLAESIGISLKR